MSLIRIISVLLAVTVYALIKVYNYHQHLLLCNSYNMFLTSDQTDSWQVVSRQVFTPCDCLLISVAFIADALVVSKYPVGIHLGK